jgi:acyl carrier protein
VSNNLTSERDVLLAAIAGILGLPSVSASDSFFDLGGDSLAAVEIAGLLEQASGASVELDALFEASSFGQLFDQLDR